MADPGLFLMTLKGLRVLEALVRSGRIRNIKCVISQTDPSVEKDYFPEIEALCREHSIRFFERKTFDDPLETGIAVGWKWLIHDVNELIVFHDSILPKYRGFNPLVSMLINGEREIGVTALYASDDYDRGSIIDQRKLKIDYPLKIQDAIEMISELYGDLILDVFEKIDSGAGMIAIPQKETDATYSLWRNEDDYRIDWNESANRIKRTIDAMGFPYKGSATRIDGQLIRILDAEEVPDVRIENRKPGKVIFMQHDFPVVVCGTGLLKILRAEYDADKKTVLPLKKFRQQFQ